jgi:hypothetical protein
MTAMISNLAVPRQTPAERHQAVLRKCADEYRERGYQVEVEPLVDGFRPDLLASKGEERWLAWSLFEAAARRRLLEDDFDPGRPPSALGLVKALVQLGYVDDPEAADLTKIAALRNEVTHGAFSADIPPETLRTLAGSTRQLLTSQTDD